MRRAKLGPAARRLIFSSQTVSSCDVTQKPPDDTLAAKGMECQRWDVLRRRLLSDDTVDPIQ
eukprot:scaffold469282_cov17-Prasinocladus_malaysianus.AAC.1